MAANSDSTLTNSHGASSPDFTIAAERLDDVRLRGDRVGADDLGRQRATAVGDRPGALDLPDGTRPSAPSLGRRPGRARRLPPGRLRRRRGPPGRRRRGRRRRCPRPPRPGTARRSRPARTPSRPGRSARRTRRAGPRSGTGRPRCSAGQLGRRHGDRAGRVQLAGELADAERRPDRRAVLISTQPSAARPVEHVDLVQQGRVLDDQGVRVRSPARGCGSAGRRCGRTRPPARRSAPSRSSGRPARTALGERRQRPAARRRSPRPGRRGRGCVPRTRATSAGRDGRCAAGRRPQRSLVRPAATAASGYRQASPAGHPAAPGLRPLLVVTLVPITDHRARSAGAERPVAAGQPALPHRAGPANRGVYAKHR